jgi:hypothetical protein
MVLLAPPQPNGNSCKIVDLQLFCTVMLPKLTSIVLSMLMLP